MYLMPLNCTLAAAAAKSLQSCLTLCDPIDGSPPGSAIPRILHIVLGRLRKEAKKRLYWLGRFGHRLDPWRGDKDELESRMVGLFGEEGGGFSEAGRMA